jgi:hypothetical protein
MALHFLMKVMPMTVSGALNTQCEEDIQRLTIATVDCKAGGHIGISRLPGRFGLLDEDIEAIRQWKPRAVVTMNTALELEAVKATQLGARLEALGILWFHLPVSDYCGLTEGSAQRWPSVSKKLHEILAGGGNVLTHCRGGHGRSGMVALRILVEQGEDPDDALARIRTSRPGAVETKEQKQWGMMR